jgi:hypothetical protein
MEEERVFASLTLLVAACEQALVELEGVGASKAFVARVARMRDEATEIARLLVDSASDDRRSSRYRRRAATIASSSSTRSGT